MRANQAAIITQHATLHCIHHIHQDWQRHVSCYPVLPFPPFHGRDRGIFTREICLPTLKISFCVFCRCIYYVH